LIWPAKYANAHSKEAISVSNYKRKEKMTDMQDEILEIGEDTQKDKYLIFSLGNEEYGIGSVM